MNPKNAAVKKFSDFAVQKLEFSRGPNHAS